MTTHISYECAKRLKEFLGESAPEPKSPMVWAPGGKRYTLQDGHEWDWRNSEYASPAYQLHDLLSKPFINAFGINKNWDKNTSWVFQRKLNAKYYDGGLPAVEKALMEMMEGK